MTVKLKTNLKKLSRLNKRVKISRKQVEKAKRNIITVQVTMMLKPVKEEQQEKYCITYYSRVEVANSSEQTPFYSFCDPLKTGKVCMDTTCPRHSAYQKYIAALAKLDQVRAERKQFIKENFLRLK